jgi:hypothetical protein
MAVPQTNVLDPFLTPVTSDAAGTGHGGGFGIGAPAGPSPASLPPPPPPPVDPDLMPLVTPPVDDTERKSRIADWSRFLEEVSKNPPLQNMLMTLGIQLLKDRPAGTSQLDRLATALEAAQGTFAATTETQRKAELEDRRFGLEEKRVGLEEKRVGLAGERVGLERERTSFEGKRVDLEGDRVDLEGRRVDLEGRRVGLEGDRIKLSERQVAVAETELGMSERSFKARLSLLEAQTEDYLSQAELNRAKARAEGLSDGEEGAFAEEINKAAKILLERAKELGLTLTPAQAQAQAYAIKTNRDEAAAVRDGLAVFIATEGFDSLLQEQPQLIEKVKGIIEELHGATVNPALSGPVEPGPNAGDMGWAWNPDRTALVRAYRWADGKKRYSAPPEAP